MGIVGDFTENSFEDIANNLKFRYLGLGFLRAWIYASWMTPTLFPQSTGATVSNDISWLISAGMVVVGLFVMAAILRDRDISSIRWIRLAAGPGTTIGSLAMAAQPLFGIDSPALAIAGAAATGITSCWLWMLWGEFTGQVEQETFELFVPMSVAVPMVIVFTCSFVSGPIAGFAICLLPSVSSFMLELCLRDKDALKPVPLLPADKRPSYWGDFLRVGIGSLAIYTCISFGWNMISYQSPIGWSDATTIPYAIGAALAIVIGTLTITFSKHVDIFGLYRWLIPVILASFILLTFCTVQARIASNILLITAQFGFDVITWVYFAYIVRKGVCRGSVAIGINRGFVQAGVFAGSVIAMAAPQWMAAGTVSFEMVLLVLGSVLSSVVLIVLNRKDQLARSITPKPKPLAPSGTDALSRVCDRLAEKAGLTGREREILGYLARGRSLPYIREELVLSKNTVDTHAKNLYRKLNVHSRQDLLDLVEAERLEQAGDRPL